MKTFETESRTADRDRLVVGVADRQVVAGGQTLVAYGLGACVAVALYDTSTGVSALATVMLPREEAATVGSPRKFADAGTREALTRLVDEGGSYGTIVGWIAGGGEIFDLPGLDEGVGERTADVVREVLTSLDVPVVGEAVGGDRGRTVEFDTAGGAVTVQAVDGERRRLAGPEGEP